nr:MAG TPA: hypothetical protein [Caudoviricetes sp.]
MAAGSEVPGWFLSCKLKNRKTTMNSLSNSVIGS